MREPASSSGPPVRRSDISRPIVLAGFVTAILLAFAYSFFMKRESDYDELVLANVVNMVAHFGELSYPAHSFPDVMVVHPPTHYVAVALGYLAGLRVFHAAGALIFVWFAACAWALWRGRFPGHVKLGVLYGLFASLFLWGFFRPLRPDLHMAAAWFCGLLLLEAGRLASWNPWAIGFGAAVLTFAAALHYPASAAFLGVVPYGIWAYIDLPRKEAARVLGTIALGGLLVGVPYVLNFWIPLWPEIRQMVDAAAKVGGPNGWIVHRETYLGWFRNRELTSPFARAGSRPIVTTLTAPWFATGIPLLFVALPLLAAHPTLRGVALGALPHLVYVLLFVPGLGKGSTNTGYYVPEVGLYLSGIGVAATFLIMAVARRLKLAPAAGASAGAAMVLAAMVIDLPASMPHRTAFTPYLAYEDIGRFAGRQLVGAGALVGSASPEAWYHSGGTDHYFVTGDLLYPQSIADVDLADYFSIFDGVAVTPNAAWATWNRERIAMISLLTKRILPLTGFVVGRYAGEESLLKYLLLGQRTLPGPLRGFVYNEDDDALREFVQGPSGNWVMLIAEVSGAGSSCSTLLARADLAAAACAGYFLPGSQRASMSIESHLIHVVLPTRTYDHLIGQVQVRQVLEARRGTLSAPISRDSMLGGRARADEAVSFPRTYSEAYARKMARKVPPDSRVVVPSLAPGSDTAITSVRTTAPGRWDILARSREVAVPRDALVVLKGDLDLDAGGIAVNARAVSGDYLTQIVRARRRRETLEVAFRTRQSDRLFVEVGAYNPAAAHTAAEIRNVELLIYKDADIPAFLK